MTNEEHRKIVDAVIDAYKDNEMGGKYSKAFNHGVQSAFNRVCKVLEGIEKQQQPCENCISREAVNALVDELARAISDERCCISRGRSTATIMRDMLHLPSVTPQRPKGKWIRITNGAMREKYICSECGRQIEEDGIMELIAIKYPYCHCGAKMEVEDA